jgi:hypothetical protein
MAKLVEIKECVIFNGFPQKPGRYLTLEDVLKMPRPNTGIAIPSNTYDTTENRAYISSRSHYINVGIEPELRTTNPQDPMVCYGLLGMPIFPGNFTSYNALFYNNHWAELFQKSVTAFLRKNNDAISAISRLF